jgi:hypothetical protein
LHVAAIISHSDRRFAGLERVYFRAPHTNLEHIFASPEQDRQSAR